MVCYKWQGTVLSNTGSTLDAGAYPMMYDEDTLIFGARDGSYFRMVSTDKSGVMKESRYCSSCTQEIEGLTLAMWDASTLYGTVDGRFGVCASGAYCLVDFRCRRVRR